VSRANLTIKYEFILWSDLPRFACRAECHYTLARYDRCTAARGIEYRSAFGRARNRCGLAASDPSIIGTTSIFRRRLPDQSEFSVLKSNLMAVPCIVAISG
jgi:hypothetical protein